MIGIVWIAESVTTHTHERDMFILRSDLNCISESVACWVKNEQHKRWGKLVANVQRSSIYSTQNNKTQNNKECDYF